MNRYKIGALLAVALVAPLAAISLQPSQADDPPIQVNVLTPRASFGDDVAMQIRNKRDGRATDVLDMKDPSRVVIAEITVQPGAQFPWHTHPGPVVVLVKSGELTYVQASDCVHRPYAAGTLFVDPGNSVHTAYNDTAEATVLYATFYDTPASGALTIPAPAPDSCAVAVTGAIHAH